MLATNAQYPNPLLAIAIPMPVLVRSEMMSMTDKVVKRMARSSEAVCCTPAALKTKPLARAAVTPINLG